MNDLNPILTEPTEAAVQPSPIEPTEAAAPPAESAPVEAPQPAAQPVPQAPIYYGGPVPPYGQPYGVPPYNPYAPVREDGSATASMVLGILSLVSVWPLGVFFGILPLVLGIIALALGVSARKRVKGGKSLAGIICGSIGLGFGALILLMFIVVIAAMVANPDFLNQIDPGSYSEAARLLSIIK